MSITGSGTKRCLPCALAAAVWGRMGRKGIIFSFDLLVAFIAMCMMMHLVLANLAAIVEADAGNAQDFSVERAGIYLLDSMVKNHDTNNPALGAAYFDSAKRRVEEGVVDYALLQNAEPGRLDLGRGVYAQRLFAEYKSGRTETFYEGARKGECITFERFVLLGKPLPEKAKIGLVVCSEK